MRMLLLQKALLLGNNFLEKLGGRAWNRGQPVGRAFYTPKRGVAKSIQPIRPQGRQIGKEEKGGEKAEG